jgi:hypothetical protein
VPVEEVSRRIRAKRIEPFFIFDQLVIFQRYIHHLIYLYGEAK